MCSVNLFTRLKKYLILDFKKGDITHYITLLKKIDLEMLPHLKNAYTTKSIQFKSLLHYNNIGSGLISFVAVQSSSHSSAEIAYRL